MAHKIFLSHNHADKPIVEPVALRLAEIFGKSGVFYDSWSIKPGDGIIDQMNKGLEAPEFVFFFVSANSLASSMVKLEWQNALFSASKGKTRIVPVRIDGSSMPPILTQTLYIDMYAVGLEAGIAQIVSVTQGNASFTPQHQGFSNLTCSIAPENDGSILASIHASHFLEPNANFLLVTKNSEQEISAIMANGQPHIGGFSANAFQDESGAPLNVLTFRTISGAITPTLPLRIKIGKKTHAEISVLDILHQVAENEWLPLPRKQ